MSNYMPRPIETNLSAKMRNLAKTRDDLPTNWIKLADDLDAATAGFFGPNNTVNAQKFLRTMARARKAWCAATGEPLV